MPRPVGALLPDPTLADLLARCWPTTCPACWPCCPRADLYLQDEVEVALHPTLTRVWCRKGRRGQRLVEAPGTNAKRYGFGLVDWRDGWLDWALAAGRSAAPFCAQLRRAVARSRGARPGRPRPAATTSRIHTPPGSKLLRALLAEAGDDLVLVYTPAYDPDANRIEWLWRALRRAVTHNHQRQTLAPLLADADQLGHRAAARGGPAPDRQPLRPRGARRGAPPPLPSADRVGSCCMSAVGAFSLPPD